MLGDLIDMNMEKVPKLFRRVEKKNKVFDFVLRGDLDECMNILNALDLDKHGVQFLCVRDKGISIIDDTRKIKGLIEMKEGTTVDGVTRFFRNLDIRLWDCISMVAVGDDIDLWLNHKRKIRFDDVVLEKGTLTVPPYNPLFKGSC